MRDPRLFIWMVALPASLSILVLAAATPWVSDGPRALILLAFQSLCHQEVERSFVVGGTALAVCHRCIGIYAGISLGLLGLPAVVKLGDTVQNNAVVLLCAALAPLALDWGMDAVGLWTNTSATRFGTGLLAGVAGGFFLNRAIIRNVVAQPNLTTASIGSTATAISPHTNGAC